MRSINLSPCVTAASSSTTNTVLSGIGARFCLFGLRQVGSFQTRMQSCYRQVRELADHIHRTTKKGCRSSAITSANAPAMNTACQTRSRFRNWRLPDLGGKQTTSTVSRCQTDEPAGCQHLLHSSVAWAQPCGSWHSRGQKTGSFGYAHDSSGTIEPHVRAAAEKRARTAAPRLTYKFPRASTWQLLGLHSEHERSEHR